MADRLTQLQEAVNQLGDYFCNSIGILQQSGAEQAQQNESKDPATLQEENAALFSNLISRTAQDIDILIEHLPSQECTPEKQARFASKKLFNPPFPILKVESLRKLEYANKQAAEKLAKAVEEGEALLGRIREALQEICDSQLGINGSEKPNR